MDEEETKENKRDERKGKEEKQFKTRQEIRVEKFLIDEIERYIRLHKEHEKEIKYIG
jgi:hypothetical protein